MRVVVTRPQADSERTAAALEALGHEVLVTPLMRIEPVAADLAGTWSAIVITSANALHAVPATADKTLPMFVVGDRSAEAAWRAGFSEVSSANGDIKDPLLLGDARVVAEPGRLAHAGDSERNDPTLGRARQGTREGGENRVQELGREQFRARQGAAAGRV